MSDTPRTDELAKRGFVPDGLWIKHARELEAELATERARLDAGTILLTVAGERVWHCGVDLRAAIDAGMREGAK